MWEITDEQISLKHARIWLRLNQWTNILGEFVPDDICHSAEIPSKVWLENNQKVFFFYINWSIFIDQIKKLKPTFKTVKHKPVCVLSSKHEPKEDIQ